MRRIGVCSWSLQASGPEELAERVGACGIGAVQLALDPLREGRWDERQTVRVLERAGISVVSGMMGMAGEDYSTLESIRWSGGVLPAEHWPSNLQAARDTALIASRLGIGLVTFHAGFLPHEPDDPLRRTMLDRIRLVARAFGDRDIAVALETGQEDASALESALGELSSDGVGVNFDPANMLLYGSGDPIGALRQLGRFVRQAHIKDATVTRTPGTWGEEAAVGEGQVDWEAFFRVLDDVAPDVDVVIEREAGDRRVDDVRKALVVVKRFVPSVKGAA